MLKIRPFLPTRCCLNISGPGDSIKSGTAVIRIIGSEIMLPTRPPKISKDLFIIPAENESGAAVNVAVGYPPATVSSTLSNSLLSI